MNVGTTDYVRVVRELPRPTLAQTERFARYVSSAHSWYKHLPIHPKVPFVFYLDPGAGMNCVHTRTGETALVEITDESKRFHYTWQKTVDYRRRFGYWNYHAAYGTSFQYAGEGGVVSTAGAGLKILTRAGDWVNLPPDLGRKGTALVSAFIHPSPSLTIWAIYPQRFGLSLAPTQDTEFPPPAHSLLGRLSSFLQQEARAQPSLVKRVQTVPPELRELIPTEASWDWPDENWLEQLRAGGLGDRLVSAVVKYVEVAQVRSQARRLYQGSKDDSPEWPREAMRLVVDAIVEERGRQLLAMTKAMRRFVKAVHS